MKMTLELTGSELMVLYIATGNVSAGDAIRQCLEEERHFSAAQKAVANTLPRQHDLRSLKEAQVGSAK